MDTTHDSSLLAYLQQVPDPRGRRGRSFEWQYLLLVLAAAIAAGASTVRGMADWAKAREAELVARFHPPCGRVPSLSTLERVLWRIDRPALEQAIAAHAAANCPPPADDLQGLALDGKVPRGVVAHGGSLCLVSLVCHERAVVLGQAAVPEKANEQTVVIGLLAPPGAPDSPGASALRQGAELAVERLNPTRSAAGLPLLALVSIDATDAPSAHAGWDRLVGERGAPVVIASGAAVAEALVPLADRQQVVLLADTGVASLPAKSPFVFRLRPPTDRIARTMAESAWREVKLRRIASLVPDTAEGSESARQFEVRFRGFGGHWAGTARYPTTADRAKAAEAALLRLARQSPDGWWFPGAGEALGRLLATKQRLGVPGQVLTDFGLDDPASLHDAQGAADGVVIVAPDYDPAAARPEVQDFITAYSARYGQLPTYEAVLQDDAVGLLADALDRAGAATGPALRDALATTPAYPGLCGTITFDAEGEANLPLVLRMMIDGRLGPVEPLATARPIGPAADTSPTDEHSAE